MKYVTMIAVLGLVAMPACRGREGTHPQDMSAQGHDAAAAAAEAKAVEEESQYEPSYAVVSGSDCSEFCFTSNPTDSHRRAADQLRREAARHRKASHDLRVAEERACAGIPELHRDLSPFYYRSHITGAQVGDKGPIVVHFDAIPKTNAEGLQRLVDCHRARNASMGYAMEAMEFCPLSIEGVSATVVATEGGFDVEIDAKDTQSRAEVAARVESLLATERE